MRPLVSVVVPTYNREHRLKKALDAILAQQVEGMEVIVVDNNSRDGTPDLVKGWADPRVIYTLCATQGIYHAINHGWARAKGTYLTWSSDDNWFHNGAISDMLMALEGRHADFVYSDQIEYDEETGNSHLGRVRPSSELERCNCIGACFLFRKSIYDRLGGHDLAYEWAADYDYWLRIYRAGCVMEPMEGPRYTFSRHRSAVTVRQSFPMRTEACLIRLAHGCHRRAWASGQDLFEASRSCRDAVILVAAGYPRKGLALGLRAARQRPWSTQYWYHCAQYCWQGLQETFHA